jgi:molybdopterin-guanine dinucleotide biosynthesis protein A
MSNSPDGTASTAEKSALPVGAILVGGRSRRMGKDKAQLSVGTKTLLEFVLDRIQGQVASVVLVGGPEDRAGVRGLSYVADAEPGGRGPLAGIAAAMGHARNHAQNRALNAEAAKDSGSPFVFVTATDMPLLPSNLVTRLLARARPGLPAIPEYQGRLQPLAALWPLSLHKQIAEGLSDGSLASLKDIYRAAGYTAVRFDDEPVDPFFNVNTPSDLDVIRHHLG